MASTPKDNIQLFSNIRSQIIENKKKIDQQPQLYLQKAESSDQKQGLNGQQIRRMNQEIILKIQKSKSTGYPLVSLCSPLKNKRQQDIAKQTQTILLKETSEMISHDTKKQKQENSIQTALSQNFQSDLKSDVSNNNSNHQNANDELQKDQKLISSQISNLSKQLLGNKLDIQEDSQSQYQQNCDTFYNNQYDNRNFNDHSQEFNQFNQIKAQKIQYQQYQGSPLQQINNQQQNQQQQSIQLQQQNSSQSSQLFQSQFLSQGISNSMPYILQPDCENSEWDTDDEQEVKQKQKYFDTVEFKPRVKFQISPQTDIDQNYDNNNDSEHYDDFDFQLDDDCQL